MVEADNEITPGFAFKVQEGTLDGVLSIQLKTQDPAATAVELSKGIRIEYDPENPEKGVKINIPVELGT